MSLQLPPMKFGDAGPSAAMGGTAEGKVTVSVSTGGSKLLMTIVIVSAIGALLWFKKHK